MQISLPQKESNKERVAFDLMQVIAQHEAPKVSAQRKDDPRAYYLQLYAQCLSIVSGDDFDDVIAESE